MNNESDKFRRDRTGEFRWSPWKTAAAWIFLVAMLAGKGIALGYSGVVIAEGIAIGLAALAIILVLIKYLGSDE